MNKNFIALLFVALACAGAAHAQTWSADCSSLAIRATPIQINSRKQNTLAAVELQPQDIRARLNGKAAAVVSAGKSVLAWPAMILLDNSGSMEGRLPHSQKQIAQAHEFQQQLLAITLQYVPPSVPVGLATFSSNVQVRLPPTTDRAQLNSELTLALQPPPIGQTALWDAILRGTDELPKGGVIFVITDGYSDTGLRFKEDLSRRLIEKRVRLFAFVLRDYVPMFGAPVVPLTHEERGGQEQLQEITRETGGFSTVLTKNMELDARGLALLEVAVRTQMSLVWQQEEIMLSVPPPSKWSSIRLMTEPSAQRSAFLYPHEIPPCAPAAGMPKDAAH